MTPNEIKPAELKMKIPEDLWNDHKTFSPLNGSWMSKQDFFEAFSEIQQDAIRSVQPVEGLSDKDAIIKPQQEYIEYLDEADAMTSGFLFAHNWKYPDEFIQRGNKIRQAITDAIKKEREG